MSVGLPDERDLPECPHDAFLQKEGRAIVHAAVGAVLNDIVRNGRSDLLRSSTDQPARVRTACIETARAFVLDAQAALSHGSVGEARAYSAGLIMGLLAYEGAEGLGRAVEAAIPSVIKALRKEGDDDVPGVL